jgi:hypothetical protein
VRLQQVNTGFQYDDVASITTRSTRISTSRLASSVSDLVIVE